MNLSESQIKSVENFRGYIDIPAEIFDEITPFHLRDQQKMSQLTGKYIVSKDKPAWITQLPDEIGILCIEWNGYIIVRSPDGK